MKKINIKVILSILLLLIMLGFYLFPLYWMAATALKTRAQIFTMPPVFIFEPTFKNFQDVFISNRTGVDTKFGFYFQMSIIISLLSTSFPLQDQGQRRPYVLYPQHTYASPNRDTCSVVSPFYQCWTFRYYPWDGSALHHV
jgi:hypothetical protein